MRKLTAYNLHVRDFFKNNKGATLKAAAAAWRGDKSKSKSKSDRFDQSYLKKHFDPDFMTKVEKMKDGRMVRAIKFNSQNAKDAYIRMTSRKD